MLWPRAAVLPHHIVPFQRWKGRDGSGHPPYTPLSWSRVLESLPAPCSLQNLSAVPLGGCQELQRFRYAVLKGCQNGFCIEGEISSFSVLRGKCGTTPKLRIVVGSDLTFQCCSPVSGCVAGTLYPIALCEPTYKGVIKGSLGNLDAGCLSCCNCVHATHDTVFYSFFNRCFKALHCTAKNILL